MGQVVLSWTASTGATSYNIYSATSSAGPFSSLGTSAATTSTISGLTNSTTYYFTVAAVNSSGASGQSPSVAATPAVPFNPVFLGSPAITQTGSLSNATSYQGNTASTSLSGNVWAPQGTYQDWYQVVLQGGTTYVVTMQTTGNSFLSIQDSTGAQVGWNDDADANAINGNPLASQVVFTPGASGTYTIICSTELPATNLTYTLTIPSPIAPVASISVPYPATAAVLNSTSYFGAAAATNMGTPAGGWVDHQQNWYSVYLTAADTYSFTMAASASTTAVLSLENSSNGQVAFSTGSTATIVYTPSISGTYTIICSLNSISSATTTYTLAIPAPIVPATTSIVITAPSVLSPQNGIVTVAVTATSGTPTGTVTLSVDGGAAMTLTLTNGSATFTITSPMYGGHTLSVSYLGAVGFQPSINSGTLSVGVPNVELSTERVPDLLHHPQGSSTSP